MAKSVEKMNATLKFAVSRLTQRRALTSIITKNSYMLQGNCSVRISVGQTKQTNKQYVHFTFLPSAPPAVCVCI